MTVNERIDKWFKEYDIPMHTIGTSLLRQVIIKVYTLNKHNDTVAPFKLQDIYQTLELPDGVQLKNVTAYISYIFVVARKNRKKHNIYTADRYKDTTKEFVVEVVESLLHDKEEIK